VDKWVGLAEVVDSGVEGSSFAGVPAHPSIEKIEGWGTLGGGEVKISKT
jgi:hypothetical protein